MERRPRIPEVGGRILVCDEDDGDGGIGVSGEDGVGCGWIVFRDMCRERLVKGFSLVKSAAGKHSARSTTEHQVTVLRF